MAVLQSLLGSIASAAKLDGYATTVEGLPGGPPLAHWRLGEAGGTEIRDRKGVRHGTYSGTIGYGASGLPQNSSNGAIDFAGTGLGTVPHDAGLALSAFSLSFWFTANGVPAGGNRWALVCRDENGDVTGDFVTMLEDDASITIGFQVTGQDREIVTPPAYIVGAAHHLVVRADSTGFDAYLDGVYLGKNANFTAGWWENVSPLRFASVPWRPETANVVLDEVALYSRVLTEAEALALAQRANLPVANAGTVNVPESATTEIDVVANDSYVGQKANLTIEIMQQPAGGDSVVVGADRNVDYTAGAVAADTARSFQYRITDPIGTSNTATVNVTVLNAGAPAPVIANCYVESGADTVMVNANPIGPALAAAIAAAPPGRNILIAPGTYTGGTATFDPSGTAANPIVVRPQNGIGTVTIDNPVWTLAAGSARLVISKLHFNNAFIELNGTNHRVTRCRFRQVGGYCVSVKNGDVMRVDHCDMSDWLNNNDRKGFFNFALPDFITGGHRDVLVDYNYLHDYSSPPGSANASTVFNTSSGSGAWRTDARVTFDHNLVRNATPLRDKEFITCKFAGVTISYNTFENVDGYLQQRQGGGWEVRSNWFENMGNTAPLKCFDDFEAGDTSGAGRALVIGNRLFGALTMWIGSGNGTSTGPNLYHASKQGRYIGNIVGGQIRVGTGYDAATFTVPAEANNYGTTPGQ